jgi:uncharacterized protein
MKHAIAVLALCLFGFSPAFAQQQLDAATKEDVQQLLEITGARRNVQVMWDSMAQQATSMAADSYQRKYPNASPLEIRKAAEVAGESIQKTIKVFSIDELFDVMIPVYQRHLTHSEIQTIIEFYSSPTGRKMIEEMPAIMSEAMQAVQPILQKHLPELEAQAEAAAAAAAAEANKQADDQPK